MFPFDWLLVHYGWWSVPKRFGLRPLHVGWGFSEWERDFLGISFYTDLTWIQDNALITCLAWNKFKQIHNSRIRAVFCVVEQKKTKHKLSPFLWCCRPPEIQGDKSRGGETFTLHSSNFIIHRFFKNCTGLLKRVPSAAAAFIYKQCGRVPFHAWAVVAWGSLPSPRLQSPAHSS